MKHKKTIMSAAFLLLGLGGLQAQETISASGGDVSGSGGVVAYSVGQIVYTTNIGANGSVAQGVQQPYEISVVLEIEQGKDIGLGVAAYPNPAADYLTLKADLSAIPDLSYSLYDINGKLLESKNINASETSIRMNHLSPATYFVKVTDGNKEVKTFKIIKK